MGSRGLQASQRLAGRCLPSKVKRLLVTQRVLEVASHFVSGVVGGVARFQPLPVTRAMGVRGKKKKMRNGMEPLDVMSFFLNLAAL